MNFYQLRSAVVLCHHRRPTPTTWTRDCDSKQGFPSRNTCNVTSRLFLDPFTPCPLYSSNPPCTTFLHSQRSSVASNVFHPVENVVIIRRRWRLLHHSTGQSDSHHCFGCHCRHLDHNLWCSQCHYQCISRHAIRPVPATTLFSTHPAQSVASTVGGAADGSCMHATIYSFGTRLDIPSCLFCFSYPLVVVSLLTVV